MVIQELGGGALTPLSTALPPQVVKDTVNILIGDVNDNAPSFHGLPYTVHIPEVRPAPWRRSFVHVLVYFPVVSAMTRVELEIGESRRCRSRPGAGERPNTSFVTADHSSVETRKIGNGLCSSCKPNSI